MGILRRVFVGLSMFTLGFVSASCGGAVDVGSEHADLGSSTLTVPYSATDLGPGSVRFSVTLPSGQHYVEVFSRKNGVQNVSHKIVASGVVNANGTTTYSYDKSGYKLGDNIEYRFYSYVGPRVFTPGPTESVWASFTYGGAPVFQTSEGNYSLADQKDQTGRTFSYQIATSVGHTFVTPFSTGWFATRASPSGTSVEVKSVEADLIGTFVKRVGSDVYDPVERYDTYNIGSLHEPHFLDITVDADSAVYPGERIDQTYAEGGHFVTIPTLIGPQSVYTDAAVNFAFLIKQKTWSGE